MNFFISFIATIFVYICIIYIFLNTILYKQKPQIIKINTEKAYIHYVIKPLKKAIPKNKPIPKKKDVKKQIVVKTTKDISKAGEKDISFDDIFSKVDSNTNDIKKIKIAKKDTMLNSKIKKNDKSLEKYVKQQVSDIKLNNGIKVQLSKDVNVTDEKLKVFYKEVYIVWNSFNLESGDTAIVRFNSDGFKLLYSNLNANIQKLFIQKLKGVNLDILNGNLQITFTAKEKR